MSNQLQPNRVVRHVPLPAAQAAAATPPDRDRIVDGVRAASLLVVVAGHAIMAVAAWPGGVPRQGNLLAAYPALQPVTWVLQIMPLFFFAGGAANALSWQRHRARSETYPTWLWARTRRLLRPVLVYLAIMCSIATAVTTWVPDAMAAPLLLLTTQLLWFLGVYLLVTALTPLLVAPRTWPARLTTLVGLLLLSLFVDTARWWMGVNDAVGLVNFLSVWTVPTLMGVWWADGAYGTVRKKQMWRLIAGALAVNGALIAWGPWPMSMVGMPGDPVSNVAPPTVVLAIHSVVIVLAVVLAQSWLRRVLEHPQTWRTVVGLNLSAMTLYLWHLPILIVVLTASHTLGWDRPTRLVGKYPVPDGWVYLAGSVALWAIFGLGVWAVVRSLWATEHAPLPWWDSPPRTPAPPLWVATVTASAGAMVVGAATLVLSATGLRGFPTRSVEYAGLQPKAAWAIAALVLGGGAIRWAGAARPER